MAAKQSFNPFDTDSSFAGGGSIFTDGTYRVELSAFTEFDFKGGPKKITPCFSWQLQQLDSGGKDVGDVSIQYWPVTPIGDPDSTVEMVDPIKGNKGCFDSCVPREGAEYDKIWGGSDYKLFLDKLKAAWEESGHDWDQVTSASDFTGLVCEMGKIEVKQVDRAPRDTDDRKSTAKQRTGPRQVVVVTKIEPEETKASKGRSKKEEPDEKPVKKGSSKTKDVSDKPEDIVEAYIDRELNVKDNYDGINLVQVKLGIARFAAQTLDKDAEIATAAKEYFDENMKAILKGIGWELDSKGKTLKKSDG